MNKKGSMELSVNSIVILVIAVTLLGLILGFITTKLGQVKIPEVAPDAPAASSGDPVTVSSNPFAVNSGKNMPIMINVYNPHTLNFTRVRPLVTCIVSGATITPTLVFNEEASISVAGSKSFIGLIKMSATKDLYLCQIIISGNDTSSVEIKNIIPPKDFAIRVE
ncbi:MAG: hypothetical protein WC916_05755 [Candidatus Woesearchaeota archaeon]